jgi:hypothetical protein
MNMKEKMNEGIETATNCMKNVSEKADSMERSTKIDNEMRRSCENSIKHTPNIQILTDLAKMDQKLDNLLTALGLVMNQLDTVETKLDKVLSKLDK